MALDCTSLGEEERRKKTETTLGPAPEGKKKVGGAVRRARRPEVTLTRSSVAALVSRADDGNCVRALSLVNVNYRVNQSEALPSLSVAMMVRWLFLCVVFRRKEKRVNRKVSSRR